jgi:hypothetical protein
MLLKIFVNKLLKKKKKTILIVIIEIPHMLLFSIQYCTQLHQIRNINISNL